jgi:hypothetical protein
MQYAESHRVDFKNRALWRGCPVSAQRLRAPASMHIDCQILQMRCRLKWADPSLDQWPSGASGSQPCVDPNVVVSGQAASSGEREAALLEQSSNTKFVTIVAISLVSREGSAHFNVGSASAEFGNQCASTQARADAAR